MSCYNKNFFWISVQQKTQINQPIHQHEYKLKLYIQNAFKFTKKLYAFKYLYKQLIVMHLLSLQVHKQLF